MTAGPPERGASRVIAVLAEPGRQRVTDELLGAAARLGPQVGAAVHALCPGPFAAAALAGAGRRCRRRSRGLRRRRPSRWPKTWPTRSTAYVRETAPWAVLAPSTAFGREVAGRAAAATGSGLVGDAIALAARDDALVASKPAFAGALVADITCRSATQMVTVRPGVLRGTGAPDAP